LRTEVLVIEKTSPHLSLRRRGTRLSLNLSLRRRGAAGGEVRANVKTPLLNLDKVYLAEIGMFNDPHPSVTECL